MKREMFEELLESVQEGVEILRGERKPSRRFEVATGTSAPSANADAPYDSPVTGH